MKGIGGLVKHCQVAQLTASCVEKPVLTTAVLQYKTHRSWLRDLTCCGGSKSLFTSPF